MRHPLLRSLVVCVALLFGLAACADQGGEDASPEERLENAADATAGEGTAAFSMEVSTETGEDDEAAGQDGASMSLSFSGEGVTDFDEEVGRMEMELPAMGTATQTIFHEGTVYTQIPMGAGAEEQWIRQEGGGASTPGMDGDPIEMVEVVEAAEGDIEELGEDEIRGVDVDGFAFTVSGSELAQGDEDAPQGMGDVDVPMEVWLDGEDRVRRLVMELDTGTVMQSGTDESADGQQDGAGSVGDMGTLTVTMEFFDFGTDVDVELPADENVISADEFQRQMQDVPGLGSEGAQDSGALEGGSSEAAEDSDASQGDASEGDGSQGDASEGDGSEDDSEG